MKSEAEYKLETAIKGLDKYISELRIELEKLDIFAAYEARLKLSAVEGVLMFMKEKN